MAVETVGIAGITGKFASCILRHLLKTSSANIHGYCRDPSKISPKILSSPRVQIIKGDSGDEAVLRSFAKGCDVVICCYLGDNHLMIEGQKKLINACEKEGVPRYIASDYTLDYTKLEYGELPIKDPMKLVHDHLQTKTKVAGVHVLIGAFMDTLFSPFFGFFDYDSKSFRYWGTGEEQWESTTYDNAAEFVVAVALDESATGFQRFIGDCKSTMQIAEIFEEVYGGTLKLNQLGSLDDLYKHMHQRKDENPQDYFRYLPLFFQFYCLNGQTHLNIHEEAAKYQNIPHTTFRQFFEQNPIETLAAANANAGS
ncbi:nmrA-like family protein [Aspergillus ambiguus]|uniref:NmrA-like family protein n=1 Tax=Aspergillus ambiguus TaxID=176160 RepID=UPI003CCDD94E